jgi:tetraprenyl-beta-curcumene synthase
VDEKFSAHARRFLIGVVPQAAQALRRIKRRAALIADAELRRQALESIAHKDFHVHGGCILATFLPPSQARQLIALVASFETAVDYLDNLCDRTGSDNEEDFRALHEALADAVTPGAQPRDYFRERRRDDSGYLRELVLDAQARFASLPSYGTISPHVRAVTDRYCELQALKHLPQGERERACERAFGHVATDLRWWEGAAACGSTLPTFALAYSALRGSDARSAAAVHDAYFPYISSFHILLDYFIDQAEDRAHAELNFVACYPSSQATRDGLARIGARAIERSAQLPDGTHHAFATQAMCAFYCSRPKIADQGLTDDAAAIAGAVGLALTPSAFEPTAQGLLAPLLALYRRAISV